MNLLQAKNIVFQMIDSYSRSGNIQDQNSAKLKDYTYKVPGYFDIAQKQISTIKKIVKSKKFSHNLPTNALISPLYQFDIVQYVGTDQTYSATGAKAYYFEVDDVATVYIEEQINGVWTVLTTINNLLVNAGVFTAYKGLISASNVSNSIRIRFSGTTGYNHRNRALFTFPFSDASRIPNYQRYVLYTMPSDFYKLNKVILKGNVSNSQQYETTADFYWEKGNQIAIGWYNQAEYSVEYFSYPTTIDSTTQDDYEFETDIDTHSAIVKYVASQLLINENNSVGDRLFAEYQNMLANFDTKISSGVNSIENTLFTGNGTQRLF